MSRDSFREFFGENLFGANFDVQLSLSHLFKHWTSHVLQLNYEHARMMARHNFDRLLYSMIIFPILMIVFLSIRRDSVRDSESNSDFQVPRCRAKRAIGSQFSRIDRQPFKLGLLELRNSNAQFKRPIRTRRSELHRLIEHYLASSTSRSDGGRVLDRKRSNALKTFKI